MECGEGRLQGWKPEGQADAVVCSLEHTSALPGFGGLLKPQFLGPTHKVSDSGMWDPAQECPFLTYLQLMLVLLAWRPEFENHNSKGFSDLMKAMGG